ncbi:MAG: fructose 1,6-bisphosphatase [Pseudomonadota bacterium]
MSLIELENPNAPISVHFKMDGPGFKEGIPLHLLTSGLSDLQSLLDKTYLGLTQRKRLSRDDRSRYYLLSKDITHGSAETDIGIVLTGIQTAFPFFSALGPTGLWEYAKQAFDFLKFVYSSMKVGNQPSYSWSGDNSQFQVNTGTQTNIYNAPVFNIGQMSVNNYESLARPIEEKVVDFVTFGDANAGTIELDASTAEVFSLPSQIETTPLRLRCEIFDFNKFENVGKLHVYPGEPAKEGDYRFEVIGDQDVSLFIEAMLRKQVAVNCLREIAPNPFSPEKVVRFQVINVEP